MYYSTGSSAGYMMHNLALSDLLYQTDIDAELKSIISCPSKYQAALDDFNSFRESLKLKPCESADPTCVDFERWAFISSLFLAGFKEPPKHFDMIFPERAKADIDGGLGRAKVRRHRKLGTMYACIGDYSRAHVQFDKALSLFGDKANFPKRWREFPSNKPESQEDMFRHPEARLMEKRVYLPNGEYHDEGAMVYLARARTELLWGNYDGALHDAKQAFEDTKKRRGPDHVVTGPCASLYGLLLALTSDVSDGLALCESAVESMTSLLGLESLETLEGRSELVQIYYIQSRFREALPIARSIAQAYTAMLGPNHRQTLRSRCLLAEVNLALGEYVTAQNEVAEIVKFARNVNGQSHPETLRYESLLAFANWHVGKLDAAYQGARKTLVTIRKECFAYRVGPSSESQREVVLVTASAPVEKETEISQLKLLKETAQLLLNSQSDENINPSVFLTLGVMARAGSARHDTARWREGRNFALSAIWVEAMSTTGSRLPLLALTYKIDAICRDEFPNMHGQNTARMMRRIYDGKRIVLGQNDPSTMAARRDLITYQQCTSKKWEDPDLNMGAGGAIDMDEGDGYPVMVAFKEIVDIHEEHFGWEHPETLRSLLHYFQAQATVRETLPSLDHTLKEGLRRLRQDSIRQQRLAESLFLKSQLAVIIELTKLDEHDRAFWGTTAIHINREIRDAIDQLPDHRPGLPSKGDLAPLRRSVGIRLAKQRELAEILHIDDREATLPLRPESAGTERSDREDERAMCELLASVPPSKLPELVENDHKSALIDIQEAERREMDYMVE
ncbi:TPR-like protein [Apiospora arundinis]|uniref:TPR-like protein n=1 Tax=Apiospora arundinis TaxID=335852 RepID=A0ABR2JIW1_9PEZI